MKILSYRYYEGKNIYSYQPVVKIVLDLEAKAGVLTTELSGFQDSLISTLPSLAEHHCSRGVPGGFLARLAEGTLLGHVVEHVALELQTLAGIRTIYGKTMSTGDNGIYEVVLESPVKEAGYCAAQKAVDIIQKILKGADVNIEADVKAVREAIAQYCLGPSTKGIIEVARKRSIPVMRLGEGSILQLGYGCQQKRVEATITEHTGCIGVDIAGDKALTKELLADAGIPVPWGKVVRTELEALLTARKIAEPVVIKPFNGNQGHGVALDLHTEAEIKRAFAVALSFSNKVIVEKYLTGRHYRLLVVNGQMVAAAEKFPPQVTGDGVSTVKELIEAANKDPRRGMGHEKSLTCIKVDSLVLMVLAKQGLTIDSMPAKGQIVLLRESANLSTGGTARDVTGQVHPANAALACRAASIIGLDVAGIDLVAVDIAKPIDGLNGAAIEVNAAPGLRMHLYPSEGSAQDAAGTIVETLFPKGAESRIPIISVTGTNGKTTCTRVINGILARAGYKVGMTSTDGIFINSEKIMSGDCTGPASAKAVLRDRQIEVAVLETARGGIIRAGLGYDYADIGVVTNISKDHLGQDGVETLEDLAFVKALVVESINPKGAAVLNADDKYCLRLTERVNGRIIYFSLASDNLTIRRHLGAGGEAVFIKRGSIIFAKGDAEQKIIPVKAVPLTLAGKAIHNVQNVLAATAACLGLGLEPDVVREGLASFNPATQNPGRLHIIDAGGIRVIVDYGHNIAGYASIIKFLKKESTQRLIGVIGVPGDRLNESILEIGKVAGKGLDYIFIKEDANLRGRKPGEVAAILQQGIISAGKRGKALEIVLHEEEAVQRALYEAAPGDTVVIFYEKLEPIMHVIKAFKQSREMVEVYGAG